MSSNQGGRRVLFRGLAGCGACVVLALVLWMRSREAAIATAGPVDRSASDARAPFAVESIPKSEEADRAEPAQSRAEIAAKPPAAQAGARALETAPGVLAANFARPDHVAIEVEHAEVTLRRDGALVKSVVVEHSGGVRVDGLALGAYDVEVAAAGYRHRAQVVEAVERGAGDNANVQELTLWPDAWIAIVVRASDGRPFRALADDLGLEPKRLFVGAFQARAQLDPPSADSWTKDAAQVALFWPPAKYQEWELPDASVGWLELLQSPPMWVGLRCYGVELGWEHLAAGAGSVTFTLDVADLDTRFARVKLRVVDETGAPALDAQVTLRADTSAHRRAEHERARTDGDGRVELTRIVPGRYELSIARGEALYQDRIELAAAERRDLGSITVATNLGFEVHVVDERGEPASAFLEIAPYRRGAREDELYPPMLWRMIDEKGVGRLPIPSQASIVRARGIDRDQNYRTSGHDSLSALIEPSNPPTRPLTLVIRETRTVHFEFRDNVAIEVFNELDLVVRKLEPNDVLGAKTQLLPGRYRARTLTADGAQPVEVSFVVEGEERIAVKL